MRFSTELKLLEEEAKRRRVIREEEARRNEAKDFLVAFELLNCILAKAMELPLKTSR